MLLNAIIVVLLVLESVTVTVAQSFNVTTPVFWQNTTITTPVTARIKTAEIAFQPIFDNLVNQTSNSVEFKDNPLEFSMPGTFFWELALFDYLTNQTTYRDKVQSYFASVAKDNPDFTDLYIDTALVYGYAAMQAHRAYGDSLYLQYAENSWAFGWNWTIKSADVQAGSFPGMNWTIPPQCSFGTIAGGTFWQAQGLGNTYINALATGAFFVLSALLAEATSNQTYMEAAQSTFTFFTSVLISDGIVRDGIPGNSCGQGGNAYPYNSGLVMEGMAILNSLQPLSNVYSLYNIISAATNATMFWQPESAHRIIVSDAGPSAYGHPTGGGDIHLIRGIMAVHTRTVDPLLQNYTASYLAIQVQ
ncbi:hypothetical protein BT96DRAFT_918985 [Gymnopus androsaceus JB14]|uniref:Six-hairpin glycosidase n=1 Tax=Gymnopus androsaceus JB14 TaxID=1447944 RepID=A0A6A4HTN3_9AGAR|nr:hypothetical protein BT96DRAFT_918985 [Gymnopus androsaceus JB14]